MLFKSDILNIDIPEKDWYNENIFSDMFTDIHNTRPTVQDIGDEEKINISFCDNKSIWLYMLCDSIDNLKRDRTPLKGITLYESPNVALAKRKDALTLFNGFCLARCALDVTTCLDLLDLSDTNKLQNFYTSELREKGVSKSASDSDLLLLFIKKYGHKSVRNLHRVDEKLHAKSSICLNQYIIYKVVDPTCISSIELVKKYK